MKIKTLVAAMALAAVSTGANAAIVHGSSQVDGELFLTVFDEVGQKSYALDLGFTFNQMSADTSLARSYDLSTDANFASFMNNANLRYTVTGANTEVGSSRRGTTTQQGFMVTTSGPESAVAIASQDQGTAANGVIASITNMALNSNASAGVPYAADGSNGDINLSNVALIGEIGYYGDATWGDTLGNRGVTASDLVGNEMNMYWARVNEADQTGPLLLDVIGNWNLTSTGQLSYAGVSAVPVPAAVWLFGSGLIGLAGIARRKQA